MSRIGNRPVEVPSGVELKLHYDPEGDTVTATRRGEKGPVAVPLTRLYWFAWYAFHPKTTLDGEALGE